MGRPNTTRSLTYLLTAVDEPVAVADAFGGDQRALGVQAVQDVLEALPFLADQVLGRDLQVLEEQLVGLVVHHVGIGRTVRPLPMAWRRSTMKIDMPSLFFLTSASGVVRASRIIRSLCWMRLIHTFWPLTT
jgi:hypothetical protein